MDQYKIDHNVLDAHSGCYGNFDPEDIVCKGSCAISIRCAIERDRNIRMEILENLMDDENQMLKIQ